MPFQSNMTEKTKPQVLMVGVPFDIAVGINNTGTGFSQYFAIPPASGKFAAQLGLQARVLQGAYTVLTAQVEISLDGGTTWTFFAGIFDLFAVPAQVVNIIGGAIYRLNVLTFTGSGTPLLNVTALIG